jgi:hypothetical protein
MKGFKTGGRKLGTSNLITADLRALLSKLTSNYLETDLEKLEPSKRAELIVKLLPYLLPRCEADESYQSTEPLVIVTQAPCPKCSDAPI